MSRPARPSDEGYLRVLRTPGVLIPVLATATASLPIGMLSLAVLFLFQGEGGSAANASSVVAALGVGTGLGIVVQGRLMDGLGSSKVLLTAACLQLATLAGLVAVVRTHAPLWCTLLIAFLAGGSEPQVGGCLRALWPSVLPVELLPRAMALSGIVFELPLIAGPILLTACLLILPAEATVLLAGAFFATGACLLATSRTIRQGLLGRGTNQARPGGARRLLGPLTSAPLRRPLVVVAGQGAVTGLLQISCAFAAVRAGHPSAAGLLYASLSVGSLVGTLVCGSRLRPDKVRRTLLVLNVLLVPIFLTAAAFPRIIILGVCALVTGLVLGPLAVTSFLGAEHAAPGGATVATFTSLTATGLAATALGSAVAGQLLDLGDLSLALVVAAAIPLLPTIFIAHSGSSFTPAKGQ